MSAISCQLGGFDPTNSNGKCLGIDAKTGKIGYVESGGGAIAVVGKLIDTSLTPPASSMQYIAYLKNNFGVAKNTYAQTDPGEDACINNNNGVGFCTIEPLLDIWVVMRNIVYLIFILVFIIIGMGIMLRIHIDPRTVMTIQNQIPKIIVGIVAITFSFAIAGFLIDIMWVTVYLFASVITQASGAAGTIDTVNITQATNPFQAANAAADPIGGDIPVFDLATTVATAFSTMVTDFLRDAIAWDILRDIVGVIINALAVIIIFIAILVALFRLWISLLFAFINIILDIIFAPWWILAGLLPGNSLGLGGWLRDIIANLAVFPVTIGFLLLGLFLMSAFSDGGSLSTQPIAFPLLGGQNPSSIAVLIGFGFILMLPNILSSVKAALKTPKLNFGNMMSPVGAGAGFLAGSASKGINYGKAYRSAGTYQGEPKLEADGKWHVPEGKLGKVQSATRMFTGKLPKTFGK